MARKTSQPPTAFEDELLDALLSMLHGMSASFAKLQDVIDRARQPDLQLVTQEDDDA